MVLVVKVKDDGSGVGGDSGGDDGSGVGGRPGHIVQQYSWDQNLGPLLAKIPKILLVLLLFCYCWSSKF